MEGGMLNEERIAVVRPKPPPRFTDSPREGVGAFEPLLHEPPAEDVRAAAQLQRRSLLAAGVNLSKAILGVGFLALPRVFSLLGIGTATIWLVFIACLTYASMHMLAKAAARTNVMSYSELVREHLGLFGQTVLDLAVIANGFLMMVVMLVVVGDVLVGEGRAEGLLSPDCGDRRTVLGVVTVLLLAPMVSATRTRATTGASALGVVAILGWAAITLCLFLVAASNDQLQPMHWWPSSPTFKSRGFESAVQMVGVLPILVVACLCQMSLLHMMRDVAEVREGQIDKVSVVAVSLSTAAFLVISICAYGLFGSKHLHADVLSSFTVKALEPVVWTRLAQAAFMLVRLGYFVALLALFPLQMAPFRDSLWALLFRQQLQGPGLWLVTYLVLVAVYFSAAYITSIWGPLLVLGSTAGVLIAFIFPGLMGAALEGDLAESEGAMRSRKLGGWLLALVGVVIGLAGLIRVLFYNDPISD